MTTVNADQVWTEAIVVGRIGRQGRETHAVTCEVSVKDEGKPWASKQVRRAHALCSSGRIGYRTPHSLQFNVPVNAKTVTCENCRQFTRRVPAV